MFICEMCSFVSPFTCCSVVPLCIHVYKAAKARPVSAAEALTLVDVSQVLKLGICLQRCDSVVGATRRRNFSSSSLVIHLWGSAVVSAPSLHVFLTPESAPEVTRAHRPVRLKGAEVAIEANRLPRQGGCWGRDWNTSAHQVVTWVSMSPRMGEGSERRQQLGVYKPAPAGALLSANGGRGCWGRREARMVALSFVHHSTMVLFFSDGLSFLHKHSQLQNFSLPAPQTVSSQSTVVPSRVLSNPHVRVHSFHDHQWTPISGWGMQGCSANHLHRSQTSLPQTTLLWAPEVPFCSSWTLHWWGGFYRFRNLSSPSLHARGSGPIILLILFFSPFSFSHLTWFYGDLSCPFINRCLRSSASVQQVLCENFSMCRCILDEFVGERWVPHPPHPLPSWKPSNLYFSYGKNPHRE